MLGGIAGYMSTGCRVIGCTNYGFSSGEGIIGFNDSSKENLINCKDEYDG